MSSFWSRIVVAVVGLPVVLYLVWLGGWWLFALLAVAATLALHELFWIARPLRPLVLAGYAGALLALLGAWLGGAAWMTAGFATTFALAFVLKGVSQTRQSITVAVGATVLGAGWVGLGLGHVVLLRAIGARRRRAARRVHGVARRLRLGHDRLFHRAARRPAPHGADDLARQDVGGADRGVGDRDPRSVLRHVQLRLSGRLALARRRSGDRGRGSAGRSFRVGDQARSCR